MTTDIATLLVENRRFMMYKALHLVGYNYHDAEDLVSETIILALTKCDDWYKQTCKFTSWIRWRMLDAVKYFRFGRHIQQPLIFLNDSKDAQVTDSALDDIEFFNAVSKLPFPKLAVMNEQGYFDREIAEALGVSRQTVHKWHKANKEHYEDLINENHNQQ